MKNLILLFSFPAVFLIVLADVVSAQSATLTLNQAAQRDLTIASGNALLAERGKTLKSDEGAPDPFLGRVEKVPDQAQITVEPVVETAMNESDLLRNLANRMTARGTAIMGADKFLLLSQKRLKVGESITINFDGRDYEVLLADVTSTTFTIRRNELSYTRAVLISR